jgi:peptidyl-prolyl cis-trans isomerase B (cyclophilin B)
MLSTLLALALSTGQPTAAAAAPLSSCQEGPKITVAAPSTLVVGQPYRVDVTIEAGAGPTPVAAWLLNASAFLVDGEPLAPRRDDHFIELTPGTKLSISLDLGPLIQAEQNFELVYAKNIYREGPIQVQRLAPARGENGAEIDFLGMPSDQLADFMVFVETNRGPMLFKFWPEVAPEHVRNMLDLAQDGFYDGTLFHRVGPGFMIQGGDPLTKDPGARARWGQGGGPRQLKAEFSERPHVRGVLSAARSADPNSASSQFFVMHARNPGLDRQYSCFGELLPGHAESQATLDKIANAAGTPGRDGTIAPKDPQRIERALVIRASKR